MGVQFRGGRGVAAPRSVFILLCTRGAPGIQLTALRWGAQGEACHLLVVGVARTQHRDWWLHHALWPGVQLLAGTTPRHPCVSCRGR